MHRSTFHPLHLSVCLALLLWTAPAVAGALSGGDIMQRAHDLPTGSSGAARLSFSFDRTGAAPGETQEMRVAMLWMNFPETADYPSKVIFFPEFPPDMRGKGYMGWVASAASERADKEWIYLPDLRTVRKLTHAHHHEAEPESLFALSVLTEDDLSLRPVRLDDHTLLDTVDVDGTAHYRVRSTPKTSSDHASRITWVRQTDFVPVRIDLLNDQGDAVKRLDFDWESVDGHWRWRQVVGIDLLSGARTTLHQEVIPLNRKLTERSFSERTLKRGPGGFF